ncbi:RNA-binding domain-containing protein [Thermogladius sp. 4427co]|uniref:RNA-binding domain-containing protein n=1 Tax=Thermogladius sp. 4427co TaxID=3450718 RepID=UPI003F78F9E8
MERGGEERRRGVEVAGIEFSTHCHATEDCGRVKTALLNALPEELRGSVKIEEESLEGFYGNIIRVLKLEVRDKAPVVLNYLLSRLDKSDKSLLLASMDLRVDRRAKRFFLRLDKQMLLSERFVLNDSDDVVKVVVYFRGVAKPGSIESFLKQLISG